MMHWPTRRFCSSLRCLLLSPFFIVYSDLIFPRKFQSSRMLSYRPRLKSLRKKGSSLFFTLIVFPEAFFFTFLFAIFFYNDGVHVLFRFFHHVSNLYLYPWLIHLYFSLINLLFIFLFPSCWHFPFRNTKFISHTIFQTHLASSHDYHSLNSFSLFYSTSLLCLFTLPFPLPFLVISPNTYCITSRISFIVHSLPCLGWDFPWFSPMLLPVLILLPTLSYDFVLLLSSLK